MKIKLNAKFNTIEEVSEEEVDEVEEEQEDESDIVFDIPNMRFVGLYGDLDEKKASRIVGDLFSYVEMKSLIESRMKTLPAKDRKRVKESLSHNDPVKFLISTFGGSAVDMFGIYDAMTLAKKDMEIHTMGSGKVMSAGVLLLAAGTKGKRTIGRNCRVMIHSVIGGAHGSSHDIENEVDEILNTQKQYIQCLSKETNLSISEVNELITQKRNVYLSAKEAIKYGIADKIM